MRPLPVWRGDPALAPRPLSPRRALGLLAADARSAWRARRNQPGAGRRPPSLDAPVFVIGAPRSGTTHLGSCLGATRSLAYHFEPQFTKALAAFVASRSIDPAAAARLQRSAFGLLAALGPPAARFAEKTPQHCFIVSELAMAFPGAQFVHIIRDGSAAAASLGEKAWLGDIGADRWEPGGYRHGPYPRFWVEPERAMEFCATTSLHRTIWAWRRHVEVARARGATLGSGRYRELRYEDLVGDPDATLRDLGDWLGLSSEDIDRMASHARSAPAPPPRQVRLDPAETTVVSSEAGELLASLGYDIGS